MNLKNRKIDKSWTLFLDRDGVINKKKENDYVLKWEQFEFISGTLDAIKELTSLFGKIIIVTNQQGIGRGYMTETDLKIIHKNMLAEINSSGGKIDAVYFAPQIKESNHSDRKPNVGMALKAKKDFPAIDFRKSIMAGDSLSDMEFGHRLGMLNVLINEENILTKNHSEIISLQAKNLKEFVLLIKNLT